jgi:hypothetical protein
VANTDPIKYVLLEFDNSELAKEFVADVLGNELGMELTVRGHFPTARALANATRHLAEEEV